MTTRRIGVEHGKTEKYHTQYADCSDPSWRTTLSRCFLKRPNAAMTTCRVVTQCVWCFLPTASYPSHCSSPCRRTYRSPTRRKIYPSACTPSCALIIQLLVIAFISFRSYHRSHFREMYQRSRKMGMSENSKRKIAVVIKRRLIMPDVFAVVSPLYTISSDRVHIGDPFTFPFMDVMPIKTTSVTVYPCKYVLYALPVYFAQIEVCFLNVTYMYSTDIVKSHFQILGKQVEVAMINKDEHKLKIAIKHHQEVLKRVVFHALYNLSRLVHHNQTQYCFIPRRHLI